ncbi:hypothetical protein ABRP29_06285 [Pseudomonas sp. WHRI 8822A]|uniref:hypothetical protein n=1 Tax=Pseudomonas sp. WHRI 8822A TaxID=3162568 RepID=UPI0032EB6411
MSESMKVASIWVVWAFLATGALGWALFTVLVHFRVQKDAAAWVQAIGSIFAIIAAIWIAGAQARRERNRIRSQQQVMNVIVLDIANRAKRHCRALGAAVNPFALHRKPAAAYTESIEAILLELKGIDLAALGTAEIAAAVLSLRGACIDLLDQIAGRVEKSIFTVSVMPWMNEAAKANNVIGAAQALAEACKKHAGN